MGVGCYLSEYTTEESYLKKSDAFKESLVSSLIMFVSYGAVGLIPLFPFILFQNSHTGVIVSVVLTLIALFCLGVISSKLLKLKMLRISLRMAILGGIAIGIGLAVGKISGNY